MKVFGRNIPVFVLFLAVLALQSVSCKKHKGKQHKQEHKHKQPEAKVDTCQPGDYYVLSHILGFYAAYATKYLGWKLNDCPLAYLACHTYVHKEGHLVYFWKKECGTVQVVLTLDEVNYVVNSLGSHNVEQLFDELVGANGAPLTPETATFAENLKVLLQNLLDQKYQNKFLANFNGPVLYHNVFPEKGVHLDAKTSPLCELVDLKTAEEFTHALDGRSSIMAYLRSVSDNPNVGSNQLDYHLPNNDLCWKYVFGHLTLTETLPNELNSLYKEAGLSTHGVDFYKLALASLTADGVGPYLKDWLPKLWVDHHDHYDHHDHHDHHDQHGYYDHYGH